MGDVLMGDIVERLRAQADPRRARGPLIPLSRLCDAAADEIVRLRELIRRALADGMDVLDEPDYDLYNELATYLTPGLRPWQAKLIDDMLAQPEGTKIIVNMPPQWGSPR